jgi:general secretion pathway protein G
VADAGLGSRDSRARLRARSAFTLIELLLTIGVVGTLCTVAIVNYSGYVEKARIARCIAELQSMSRVIDSLALKDKGDLPETLAEADLDNMIDPWGNAYAYLKIAGTLPPGQAGRDADLPAVAAAEGGSPKPRKDQFLVPINSDYDLYSKGPDGQSQASLSPPVSRDDVIRALDGAFVGVAENF